MASAVVREALPLLHLLQRQRLVDARLAPPTRPWPEALREQWARFEAAHKAHAEALGTGAAYDKLVAAGQGPPPQRPIRQQRFAARTPQILALIDLLGAAADGSNLTLDPDLDTYYLMDAAVVRLPAMAECAGQLASPAAAPTGAGALDAAAVRHVAAHGETLKLNQARAGRRPGQGAALQPGVSSRRCTPSASLAAIERLQDARSTTLPAGPRQGRRGWPGRRRWTRCSTWHGAATMNSTA